jgi:phospholipase C
MRLTSPIKHVVIIVKENHGYDNYFGPFPGGSMEDCFDFTQQPLPPPR